MPRRAAGSAWPWSSPSWPSSSPRRWALADAHGPRLLVVRLESLGWRAVRALPLPAPPSSLAHDGGRFLLSLRGQGLLAVEGPDHRLRAVSLPAGSVPGALAARPGGGFLVHDLAGERVLRVFVVDPLRNRILIFGASGVFRFEIPGGRRFDAPRDLAVDPEGYLMVLAIREGRENLLELDFDGELLREAPLLGLPDGSAAPALTAIALSPAGDRLYALDEANFRLWIADRDGAVTGSVDLVSTAAESRPGERMLGRVDVSGDTVLVVISSESQILLFDLDGKLQRSVGFHGTRPCSLGSPNAAVLTADGILVVVDHQRMVLQHWDPVANRCLGEHFGFGNLSGFFYYPRDLALGPEGRLYVAQGFEGRVQVFLGLAPVAGAPRPPAD